MNELKTPEAVRASMNQYELKNAAEKIEGYMSTRRPLERTEPAFERAQAECLKHLRRQVSCVEAMSIEDYLQALNPKKPRTT